MSDVPSNPAPVQQEAQGVGASTQANQLPAKTEGAKAKSPFHMPEQISAWVSVITAVVSLVISLYTLVVTTTRPELLLIMPNQVRITQGGNSGPYLYLQPTFVSTGLSERIEVIRWIRVEVARVDGAGEPVEFGWDEQGEWVNDPETMFFNWVFTEDAGPFPVSARDAQHSMGLFIGPREWLFEPGRYRITLTAERIAVDEPLIGSVEVELGAEQLEYINQSQGNQFLIFTVEE